MLTVFIHEEEDHQGCLYTITKCLTGMEWPITLYQNFQSIHKTT